MGYKINSIWTKLRKDDIMELNAIIDDEYCNPLTSFNKKNLVVSKIIFNFAPELKTKYIMIRETKIKGMVVKTFGLEKKEHDIAVDRIKRGDFGNMGNYDYFITIPTEELVRKWIDQDEDNASFLSDALNNGATIYTLWEHIFGDAAQPLGDIAVFSED